MTNGSEESARVLADDLVNRSDGTVVTIYAVDASAAQSPKSETLTQIVSVVHPGQECTSLVLIHAVNGCSAPRCNPRRLLKFSKRNHALTSAEHIQLGTLAYYRNTENLNPSIADPDEGKVHLDGTTWLRILMRKRSRLAVATADLRSVRAELTFAPARDPWIYCTSMYPENLRSWESLESAFLGIEKGYEATTGISDSNVFAQELGVDFAGAIDPLADIKTELLDHINRYIGSRMGSTLEGTATIRNIVHVYHGPVVYERLACGAKLKDFATLPNSVQACFTKDRANSAEREYRFALWCLGSPKRDFFHLSPSDHLRSLARDVSDHKTPQPVDE